MPDKKKRKELMKRYHAATKQVSLNQLRTGLSNAVYSASPAGQAYESQSASYPKYWYLDDILIDESKAVVCADGMYYTVPYTVGNDGSVSLGAQDSWKQVVQKWVEVS